MRLNAGAGAVGFDTARRTTVADGRLTAKRCWQFVQPWPGLADCAPHSPPMPCRPAQHPPANHDASAGTGAGDGAEYAVGPDRPHQPRLQTAQKRLASLAIRTSRSRRCSSICFTGLPFSATVFDPATSRSAAIDPGVPMPTVSREWTAGFRVAPADMPPFCAFGVATRSPQADVQRHGFGLCRPDQSRSRQTVAILSSSSRRGGCSSSAKYSWRRCSPVETCSSTGSSRMS